MSLEQIFYRFSKENDYYYRFKRITELKFNGLNYYSNYTNFQKSMFYYGVKEIIRGNTKTVSRIRNRWLYFLNNCVFLKQDTIKDGDYVSVKTPFGELSFKCKVVSKFNVLDEVTNRLYSMERIVKINSEERKPSWFVKYKGKTYGIES